MFRLRHGAGIVGAASAPLVSLPLRSVTGDRSEVEAEGATVRDLLEDLERRFPGIRARVAETAGELVLELEGAEDSLEQGIQFLEDEGVQVTAAEGDVLE